MISHKETLRELNLDESLASSNRVDPLLWDCHIVKALKSCKKLFRLSLPLLSNSSMDYYREMIASFPDLKTLTIYDTLVPCANWSRYIAMILFSASTNLEIICFKGSLPNYRGTREQRFERKELEQLWYCQSVFFIPYETCQTFLGQIKTSSWNTHITMEDGKFFPDFERP